MRFPILVEPLPHNRFRAVGPIGDLSAEGNSAEEARDLLQRLVWERISAGAQVTWIETQPQHTVPGHPLAKHAGAWRDDPLFEEYLEAVEEYRRQREEQDPS